MMNAQLMIKQNGNKTPSAAQGAEEGLYRTWVLTPDGKVIISTLPGENAAGADLFRQLLPSDREMFATGRDIASSRFFFCSEDCGYILLTGLLAPCGVIFAVESDAVRSEIFKKSAKQYGIEELICKNTAPPSDDGAQVSSVIRFALGVEKLFSETGRTPLTTNLRAEEFFNSFSLLAGIRSQVGQTVAKKALFKGVDYKSLGLATLLISALAQKLGGSEIFISFAETGDRHSIKVEFAVEPSSDLALPNAQSVEELFGSIFALKCKNLHAQYAGPSLVFSLCPSVFDPDAQGLMQGRRILRTDKRKGKEK